MTLEQMIEIIKAENPNGLRVGNDQEGYTKLSNEEYDATIKEWANARLQKINAQHDAENARKAVFEKLGLSSEEINILLGQ